MGAEMGRGRTRNDASQSARADRAAEEGSRSAPPTTPLTSSEGAGQVSIILPDSVVAYRCACGAQFYSVPLGQRHAARCEKAAMMADAAAKRMQEDPVRGFADPEARQWIDQRLSEGKPGTKHGRPA